MNRLSTRNRTLAVAIVTLIFLVYQSTRRISPRFRAKVTILAGEPRVATSTQLSDSQFTSLDPETHIPTVVDSFLTTDLMKQVILQHDTNSPNEIRHWPRSGLAFVADWQMNQERRREQEWLLDRLRIEQGDQTKQNLACLSQQA